ncbi:hypothetical protein KP79_PYT10907 [Mizuhopecten yessoensis]|uniref:CUB domain-containing protein n=1 Tax=Mizuhopecten yessoensis TaxID=6573 RepID=A0A210PRL0_MIZYE|nr:hypothetical protein KP79_PYT10907 [Mizuhopecten yessoensis]
MTEMSQWIENTCIPALFIALMVYRTDAYSSVTLDASNCNSKTLYISHEQSQRIRWTGEVIPARCRVGFEATEAPHAVCVDIEIFRVDHCFFTLGIYENLAEYPVKRYDCASTDTTEELCFDHKRIYLGFTFNSTGEFSNPSVKIKVKVKKDENAESEAASGETVPGVIGLLLLMGFLIVVFNKKLKQCLKDPCDNIFEPLCGLVTFPCCFLKEKCQNCVTSVDTSECRKVMACCQPRFQEPEATTTTSTVVATDNVTQQEDFDDVLTVDLGHPSAAPTDNGWAPPPYQAPPPDSTHPEAPPPSYYDVVTGNVSVSNA